METKRELAIFIVELFEELLEKQGIIIPDEDRPDDNDTPIYGVSWGELVDGVMELIG